MECRHITNLEIMSGDLVIDSENNMWLIIDKNHFFDFQIQKINYNTQTAEFFALYSRLIRCE